MATLQDKAFGGLLILLSLIIFTYYTLWVIVLPFVESDHFLHGFFLPPVYAIIVPIGGLVMLMCLVGTFVAVVLIRDSLKKKSKTH